MDSYSARERGLECGEFLEENSPVMRFSRDK
jgi:hypothetical protein